MFVYKITNKVNGKNYVGKTEKPLNERYSKHLQNAKRKVNRYLYDAMNHYGYNNFEISLIEECSIDSTLDEREIYWIKTLNTLYPNGYNMTEGGGGGFTLSKWREDRRKELYQRQAQTRTGMKRTEEQKNNFKIAAKERANKRTEEEKRIIGEKISKTMIERGISPPEYLRWKKGQEGTFKGQTHTPETRQKLSKFRKGKSYGEIMGEEKSSSLKQKRKENFIGEKNPNYIEFPKENKLFLLNILLQNPETPLKELIKLSGINSKGSKVSQFLKESGIKNLQKFRRLDYTTQKQILLESINYVNRNY